MRCLPAGTRGHPLRSPPRLLRTPAPVRPRSTRSRLASSIAAADLHRATIRPIRPAGQIGGARPGAPRRVAGAPGGFDAACFGVFAERRRRTERDGVAERLFGAAGIPERVETKPSELERREGRACVARERAPQAV